MLIAVIKQNTATVPNAEASCPLQISSRRVTFYSLGMNASEPIATVNGCAKRFQAEAYCNLQPPYDLDTDKGAKFTIKFPCNVK